MLAIGADEIRRSGTVHAMASAIEMLSRSVLKGFWLHLDVDVLRHDLLPAADFPSPGGLDWDDLEVVLSMALATSRVLGMEITIFNAKLDPDGRQTARLASFLAKVLSDGRS